MSQQIPFPCVEHFRLFIARQHNTKHSIESRYFV